MPTNHGTPGRSFCPDTPFIHHITLIVIGAQLFKQRVEIECRCPAGNDGYRQYAHDRASRGGHAAPAPVIFFDVHVIEIADNLHMFKIVFDDVTAGIGEY